MRWISSVYSLFDWTPNQEAATTKAYNTEELIARMLLNIDGRRLSYQFLTSSVVSAILRLSVCQTAILHARRRTN